jgi:hypothetical protein
MSLVEGNADITSLPAQAAESDTIHPSALQDVAELTLYCDTHIWKFEQSQALALRMITSTSSRPGSYIKSLTVHFCDWSLYGYSKFWDDIAILLLHAPNLAAFSSQYADVTMSVSAFATLSKLASSGLSQLCVCFDEQNLAAMHIITRFPSLEHLELTFGADTKPNFAGVEPWIMPTIRTFSWRHETRNRYLDGDAHELRFLSTCRFASRCRVSLYFPNQRANQYAILNPFFDAHQDAEAVEIHSRAPISESSTVFSIQNVKFEGSPPAATLFAQDRLPKRISLCVSIEDVDEGGYPLWSILDVLESRGKLKQSLTFRLWLVSGFGYPCPGFSWYSGAGRSHLSGAYNSFVGQLLPRALRLYSQGVIIVDENGEEVHTRIPETYKTARPQAV